uniref:Uncharacterized protein n=1 Tax=Timema poppense TaxID=170557 RepID=A0A7R9DGY3_TIMPO|nr:unnamed protein product [Timema poppensis]
MEDSPHFSESESDKKQLSLDVSIKDEINIELEMEENSPEYVDVSVNSEERDFHQQELVCDLPFIKEELEFCPKENQTKPQSIQPMSGLHCYVMYQGKQGITINTEHSGQDLDSNGIVPTIKTSL